MSEFGGWIDERRPELVRLLQDLIRARSENPPGNEAAPAAIVADRLRGLGAQVRLMEPAPQRVSVIGVLDSGKAGPSILCDAHLDTVPAGDGWTVDPFGAEVKEGHIYGRGATDHKSPIAALLQAVACLQATDRLRGRLVLIFDADEEQGGRLGMHPILQSLSPDVHVALYACATSYSSDAAAFFGLGVDNVFNGSLGLLRLRVSFTTRVAYQVAPVRWWYPAEVAAKVGVRILSLLETPAWFGPMPRSRLRTSEADEQTWHIHLLPGEDRSSVLRCVEDAIQTECEKCEGARASVELLDCVPPAFCPPEHSLVRTLVRAGRVATGNAPLVSPVAAVTGMSAIQARLGVPVAAFGYGLVELDHAPDERIAVNDLVSSAIAYAETLATIE